MGSGSARCNSRPEPCRCLEQQRPGSAGVQADDTQTIVTAVWHLFVEQRGQAVLFYSRSLELVRWTVSPAPFEAALCRDPDHGLVYLAVRVRDVELEPLLEKAAANLGILYETCHARRDDGSLDLDAIRAEGEVDAWLAEEALDSPPAWATEVGVDNIDQLLDEVEVLAATSGAEFEAEAARQGLVVAADGVYPDPESERHGHWDMNAGQAVELLERWFTRNDPGYELDLDPVVDSGQP